MDDGNYRICYGYYTWGPGGHGGKFIPDGAVKGKANAVAREHAEERVSENIGRRVCIAYNDRVIGMSICNPMDGFTKDEGKLRAMGRMNKLIQKDWSELTNKYGFPVARELHNRAIIQRSQLQGNPKLIPLLLILSRVWEPVQEYVQKQLEASDGIRND